MTLPAQRRCLQAALLALCALVFATQLVFPGFIGLANNGDFGKVAGRLCLGPRDPASNFIHFEAEYIRARENCWNSPYFSSETALAWVGARLGGGPVFDIRWLGGVHAALILAALGVLLTALRGWPAWKLAVCAVAPIAIFTDVCYSAYLNSFYMDAAALCGLLLMAAAAVWIAVTPEPRPVQLLLFTTAALLLVTAKAQHAIWMALPAAFLAMHRRWIAAALVLAAGTFMLATSDRSYRGQAMFNLLFYRVGADDLASTGVQPGEMRYIGMHSYMDGAPTTDRAWTEAFYSRTGFRRMAIWYLRHPARTVGFLRETLVEGAPEMRPINLGNYRVQDGAAGAKTSRFAFWSGLRAALFRRMPGRIAIWYAAFTAGCLVSMSRSRQLALVALGIAAIGAGEFTTAALADCLDAGRHLFLFHAATDLTFCFAAGLGLQFLGTRR